MDSNSETAGAPDELATAKRFGNMPAESPVGVWLRVHRMLLDNENAFTDLAIRAAAGEISLEQLDDAHQQAIALRSICNAAYEKAFPKPQSVKRAGQRQPTQRSGR